MKKRLLFICLGNICRSPAAEGIMRKKVEERWLDDDFEIDSAGIGSWHVGELPDRRMRRHAAQRGYELTMRARQFQSEDFRHFDYIIVMDEENYHDVMERMPYTPPVAESFDQQTSDGALYAAYKAKVLRMKDYFQKYKGRTSVPDPYYGGDKDFELALDLIEDGCDGLLAFLTQS
jgi:protein-tyrosine phosphatase